MGFGALRQSGRMRKPAGMAKSHDMGRKPPPPPHEHSLHTLTLPQAQRRHSAEDVSLAQTGKILPGLRPLRRKHDLLYCVIFYYSILYVVPLYHDLTNVSGRFLQTYHDCLRCYCGYDCCCHYCKSDAWLPQLSPLLLLLNYSRPNQGH